MQTVAAMFLIAGFVTYDMHLWRRAFLQGSKHTALYRTLLWVVPLVSGALFEYGTFVGYMESPLLASIGLMMLLIPLFDERISMGELGIRVAAVGAAWLLHHWTGLTTPRTIIGGILLLLIVGLIRALHTTARFIPWRFITLCTGFFAVYWLTAPSYSFGVRVDNLVAWQSVGLALVMSTFVGVYWERTRKHFLAQQHMQELASYDNMAIEADDAQGPDDISRLFQHAQRRQQSLVVAALDVDHFSRFNQRYGHMAGNAALVELTRVLSKSLVGTPGHDHLYQVGGEEFSIAFVNRTADEVNTIITRSIAIIRKTAFAIDGGSAHLTVSAGITAMRADDTSVDELYKRADDSLHMSKKRGCDVVTTDGVTAASQQDEDDEQLAFFEQPVETVNGETPRLWGYELLLRRYEPVAKRWILPDKFDISVNKQVELMAAALLHSPVKRVNLNLTLGQFVDTSVAKTLVAFVQSGVGPDYLAVEITDVPPLSAMRRISALYRDAGISIYIDDVGSDNSFELVRNLLPYVDGVKFAIQNLRKNEDLERIQERVRFWIGIAQQHHIAFILEGVETADDVAFARSLGIKHFQGYYFGKPELPDVA